VHMPTLPNLDFHKTGDGVWYIFAYSYMFVQINIYYVIFPIRSF